MSTKAVGLHRERRERGRRYRQLRNRLLRYPVGVRDRVVEEAVLDQLEGRRFRGRGIPSDPVTRLYLGALRSCRARVSFAGGAALAFEQVGDAVERGRDREAGMHLGRVGAASHGLGGSAAVCQVVGVVVSGRGWWVVAFA